MIDPDVLAMQSKMSKSKPGSGIVIHDSPEVIRKKINGAFMREGEGSHKDSPILNWIRYLVFYESDNTFKITRPDKYGGDIVYDSYQQLEDDFQTKKVHPQDIKQALSEWLIIKLAPVRLAFSDEKGVTILAELDRMTIKK